MRTNIMIDDELIKKAQQLTGIKTKKDVVHRALATLVQIEEQSQVRSLRGKLKWTGNIDEMREGRDHDFGR